MREQRLCLLERMRKNRVPDLRAAEVEFEAAEGEAQGKW